MKISMIAAVAKNGVIGKDNDLAWHLPDDMKYFMNTTRGHHVIMGRKNFDSIPEKYRPLPDRTNIIVTRQKDYVQKDCIIAHSMDEAYEYCRKSNPEEIFIIGGGQIYAAGLEKADRLYITEVNANVEGDTYFPDVDESQWAETSRKHHNQDDRHLYDFDFVIYDRNNSK